MSNIVGMLSSLGATSFEKNKPFSPEDLEVVKIKDRFYERNTMFHKTIKTIKVQTKFSDEIKYETVDYHFLGPVNGVSYNGVISEIFKLFQDYYFILDYINCYHVILPIGLITVPEPINLCLLTKINNNDFFISQKNIFPFELSEEKVYIVVNIEKSEEDLCVDQTFQTISIIDVESKNVETYIRIVFENKRWSDWLKYEDNISLNLNILKLITSFNELQNYLMIQLLPTNDYEIKNKIYKTNYNCCLCNKFILNLENEYVFNFTLDTEYKLKNINCFEINTYFSLDSYLLSINNIINNITHIPKNDLITFSFINEWTKTNIDKV